MEALTAPGGSSVFLDEAAVVVSKAGGCLSAVSLVDSSFLNES